MMIAETILATNRVIQESLNRSGIPTISADEAAMLVYNAGIMKPDVGPPGATGFTFWQFVRDIRDRHGYDVLRLLLGVTQSKNSPNGRYAFHRFDPPNLEQITTLLASKPQLGDEQSKSRGVESLPDFLREGLDVVFVGTSVSEKSTERGHYYSHPTNRFWDLVTASRLVSAFVGAENDHFILEDNAGLTDLAKMKASSSDQRLSETDFDILGFRQKMEKHKPQLIAFNGKRAFKEVFGNHATDYGPNDEVISDSLVFVLPSSSGTDTSMTYEQKLVWYTRLKAFIHTL